MKQFFLTTRKTSKPVNAGKQGLFTVQPKLEINAPGDRYEQEADAMADKVMRMTEQDAPFKPSFGGIAPSVQRKCAKCEQEEKHNKKEIPLMRKAAGGGGAFEASPGLVSKLSSTKSRGLPMPDVTRNFMENAFSSDFSKVRVHTDDNAAEMNRSIQARAFTNYKDIYFNTGQYNPETKEGQKILAHELAHIEQQDSNKESIQRQSYAPLASDTYGDTMKSEITQASASLTMNTIKIWFNSFIPQQMVPGPPTYGCFLGDNRNESNAIHASSRTHQEIEFNVSTLAKSIDWTNVGETREVDCTTQAIKRRATAPASQETNGPVVKISPQEIEVNFKVAAKNPLVWPAPSISADVTFSIDPYSRTCSLSGQHDGFPAYEAYITTDSGTGTMVYYWDPRLAGKTIYDLYPIMDVWVLPRLINF